MTLGENTSTAKEPTLFVDATDKLVRQFSYPGETTFADIEAEVGSPRQAATVITAIVATSFTCGLTRALAKQYLAGWHQSLRSDCSSRFALLKDANPTADRRELQSDRELQLLNGIRAGVKTALQREEHADHQARTRGRLPTRL